MRTAAVKSLVYKEFYMARKPLMIEMLNFLIFALMGVLAETSFRSGNLALLSDVIKDDLKEMVDLNAILFPVLMVCLIALSIADSSLKDEVTAWKRFCHAIPASHIDFAVSKYVTFLITVLAESAFSFIYTALICSIIGVPFSAVYAAYILAVVVLTTLMAVLNHVGILLFHTKDKAGIFMAVVLFGIILIPVLIGMNFHDADSTREVVRKSLIFLLPWMPVMTAVILAVGCAVSAVLLRRREA
ncbi:MAG: hypothetical protein J1F18_01725 [Lachnospiraceae bacterium]|nr:hypothetical protein [Lachnospiraceae bacterium]